MGKKFIFLFILLFLRYYNYTLNNNGVLEWHGDNYEQDYLTDLIGRKALNFLADYEGENPFLMVLATPSPHAPFTPAPQHKTAFVDKARITLAMDSATHS